MRTHRPRTNERESKHYAADAATVRAAAVVALLAIGTIHFLQIVPTVQQTPLLGLAYVALIAASAIVAAWPGDRAITVGVRTMRLDGEVGLFVDE